MLLWLGVVAYGYSLAFVGLKAFPYVYYDRWSIIEGERAGRISGLWIDDWMEADETLDLESLVSVHNVDLLMIAGINPMALKDYFVKIGFADSACVDAVNESSICVASKLPISPQRILNLGVNSYSGGVFTLVLGGERELQLGVMNLARSLTKESFERNRVTARRLSSIMRNSNGLRIVAGKFSASPFSQLVAVYSEQARMHSLMFGRGMLKTWDLENPFKISTDSNIFVSKSTTATALKNLKIQGRSRGVLWFEVG